MELTSLHKIALHFANQI